MWRWRLQRLVALALFAGALVALAVLASPSRPALAASDCAATGSPQGPFTFETWEAGDYKTRYSSAMDLAGNNLLLPENTNFALPLLETGDRSQGSGQLSTPYIPPVLLKAIAYIESGWAQGSYDPLVQYGQTGPTLVSADCGYGVLQVTSGMQNVSGIPNLDQSMIGGNYAFNIARGAQILAQKWNEAPEYRPIVGNRDPHVIENWYFALWAYNGFAFRNHPLNSGYDPNRPQFDCQDGTPRNYPYQELILGCVAHPPLRDGVPLWDAQPVTLPNLNDPAFSGPLDPNNWNACSQALECAAMDIPTPTDSHTVSPTPTATRADVLGAPVFASGQTTIDVTPAGSQASVDITVNNGGTGLLTWRALSYQSWAKLNRYEGVSLGSDLGGYETPLTLTVDTTGFTAGDYSATVSLDTEWPISSVTVPINVHVQRLGCDGGVSVLDALAILGDVSGVGGCTSDVGDANCDGVVNSADAILVLEYLIGLPSDLPHSCNSRLE